MVFSKVRAHRDPPTPRPELRSLIPIVPSSPFCPRDPRAIGDRRGSGAILQITLLAAVLVALLAPGSAWARGGVAVEGLDRARLLSPPGAKVEPYRNEGYRLSWSGDEVEIVVEASPLASRSAFSLPTHRNPEDPVARVARAVTSGAATHYEAISKILAWVARNIDYDLDRSQSQEALDVLDRRSGYCTGVARLTVALLRSVEVEAREVAGYILSDEEPGTSEISGGYHRWIEARLPDRGWVFSDPLRSHHYVPANYLRLSSEQLLPEKGIEGLLIERQDNLETVDLYPWATAGIRARRNQDRRLAAALRVQVADTGRGVAELSGPTERRIHSLNDGRTTFVGLDPGTYRLLLLLPGGRLVVREIELDGRERRAFSLPPQPRKSATLGVAGPGRDSQENLGPVARQGVRP